MDHPTPAVLRGFLLQTLSQDEVRSVVAHLLPGCARCSAEIASLRNTLSRQRELAKKLPTIGPSYGAAFERALATTLDQASSLQANQRSDFLEDDEVRLPAQAHKLVTLYKDLLRQSWSLRHKDPAKMLQLARRATIVANALSPGRYGRKSVADWQCRAWAELGNAYRVAEDHEGASDSFKKAFEIFPSGTQREHLQARIFSLQASLSKCRWQFENSFEEFDMAYELYLRSQDRHLAGRVLIQKAINIGYQDVESAFRLVRQGLRWIDRKREPEIEYFALHNLAFSLIENRRWQEARTLLRSYLDQSALDKPLVNLKRLWLMGQIYGGIGELEQAEKVLSQVKCGFEEAGLYYQAANVSVDLEAVWRQQGQGDRAEEIAVEAKRVFRSLQIGAGALESPLNPHAQTQAE